ncbi:MAG: hypothetical protein M9953_10055 [Thermomicrobiales bacterium]|nr:hypothetical protein [Thermomicrobiales bacterium]MCO5218574.1 hypothetical protein [Thermomicrobiales bacterium]MCO5225672.1 hypothetical protein [Thermomicrobiales bacterium]MCO5229295.1 hypothetical protein [Thermomicrobiales bacterium]
MSEEIVITTSFEIVEPLFLRLAERRILDAGGAVTRASFGVSPDAFGTYTMAVEVTPADLEAVQDVLVTELPIETMILNGELLRITHEAVTVATKFGDVAIRDRVWKGRVIGVTPNLSDCATLARRFGVSGAMVWHDALRLAEPRIGLKR